MGAAATSNCVLVNEESHTKQFSPKALVLCFVWFYLVILMNAFNSVPAGVLDAGLPFTPVPVNPTVNSGTGGEGQMISH
ncbi:hypothetical protein Hamer_G019994 [Homarus americanus]|uniref:Uncharacterized protein n=1 Tax=Homarus americanus TaxID=6706 RepID=A0A8J5JHY3_HOMAM|nr:hypothetical protein Hamer_G019994 [Homarus americanus]